MKLPNFPMMRSGFKFLVRSVKLFVKEAPDTRLMKIRANQARVCCRVIFKGALGTPSQPRKAP